VGNDGTPPHQRHGKRSGWRFFFSLGQLRWTAMGQFLGQRSENVSDLPPINRTTRLWLFYQEDSSSVRRAQMHLFQMGAGSVK